MRISKVYTKTGDDGTTGIVNNVRVSKNSLRIQAIGDLDELNSWVGVVREKYDSRGSLSQFLRVVQDNLLNAGGELSMPPERLIHLEMIGAVEDIIDELNQELPPLKDFILPSGWTHVARTVCRRAERSLIALKNENMVEEFVNPCTIQYINRLSDFLFVLARYEAEEQKKEEELWNHVKQSNPRRSE